MRVVISIITVLFTFLQVHASHIVGGEFEIKHISEYRYRINLIIYYDEINGQSGNKEQDRIIFARIYRVSDNAIVRDVSIPFISESLVNYTQPDCSNGELITSRMFYSTEIIMSPEQFGHPDGYYIIWERCCRNYNITNIFSADPNVNPAQAAGQTFYLKFPPVVRNGEPFINSTPRLFPPLNDYACPNKDYYVDFGGVDDDGDSLVYSIVTPLSTHSFTAYPPLNPVPYPEVRWRPPFSLTNILGGNPDLRISSDGFITVRPSAQGLYVFAVKCEEYRDGIKIGEVRRDFQMLVVDACPVASPPQIVGRKKGDALFSDPDQTLALTYSNTIADRDRCVEVRITDEDSRKTEDDFLENVSIRVLPLNFKNDTRYLNELLPAISKATLVNGSSADFTICLPECSYVPDGIYEIGIIAYDDACSLPLSDTLRLSILIEPPSNDPPRFVTPDQAIVINEGDPLLTIPILATDSDLDKMDVTVKVNGYVLSESGMGLSLDNSQNGVVNGSFTWDSRCDVFDFTKQTEFLLQVMVEDRDRCLLKSPDTLSFDLRIILPGNNDPVISTNLQQINEKRIEVTRKIFETLEFDVYGNDADNDFIVLGVTGQGFTPSTLGITFPGDQGNGSIESPFTWKLNCDQVNLNQQSDFELDFIVVDNANKCRIYQADTLRVVVHVEPPDNLQPELTIESLDTEQPLVDGTLSIILGTEIRLKLTGLDQDVFPQDVVFIELVDASGNVVPSGYSFTPAQGLGKAEAYFTWNPDCSIFLNNVFENNYVFTFRARDNRCYNNENDLDEVYLTIKDIESENLDFIPPNIVTPNGDGKNDYFAMVKFVPPGEYVNILPPDNCLGSFVNIRIYDRWGNQVYESSDRNFQWYARGMGSGVYFYYLNFTNRIFKGTVSVKY
jgi:hypothetical protein